MTWHVCVNQLETEKKVNLEYVQEIGDDVFLILYIYSPQDEVLEPACHPYYFVHKFWNFMSCFYFYVD